MELTDAIVSALPAPAKEEQIISDDLVKGLKLAISPKGVKTFCFQYTHLGYQRRMKIGAARIKVDGRLVGDKTVSDARVRARELRRLVDAGLDPQGEKQKEREAAKQERQEHRVERDLWPQWERYAAAELQESTKYQNECLARQWLLGKPGIAQMRVKEVRRRHIVELHRKVTAYGTPARANLLLALLGKMFTIAVELEWIEFNPCAKIKRNRENERQRYLTPDELKRLMTVLTKRKDDPQSKIVLLAMLTGCRRMEAVHARRDGFNLAAGTWTRKTKTSDGLTTPLNGHAVELVASIIADLPKDEPYLFPSPIHPGKPRWDVQVFWDEVRESAKLVNFVFHDLRHSYASMLVNSGESLPTIGRLLGHTKPDTTARYSHLYPSTLRTATNKVGALLLDAMKSAGD